MPLTSIQSIKRACTRVASQYIRYLVSRLSLAVLARTPDVQGPLGECSDLEQHARRAAVGVLAMLGKILKPTSTPATRLNAAFRSRRAQAGQDEAGHSSAQQHTASIGGM
jgi:hypothetical protein